MTMRNSFSNSYSINDKKTTMTHFKRYSQLDLRNDKIDRLLITQSKMFSQLRIKPIKTQLPSLMIPTSSINNNSYGRVSKIQNVANQVENSVSSLREQLQDLKMHLEQQRQSIYNRYQKINSLMGSKINRIDTMLQYTIKQNVERSTKIQDKCDSLKSRNDQIKKRIFEAKEKMRDIQNSMGIYTGQDKYYV